MMHEGLILMLQVEAKERHTLRLLGISWPQHATCTYEEAFGGLQICHCCFTCMFVSLQGPGGICKALGMKV